MTWFWILIGPTLVYGIVQFLEGYVLIPLIAGKATDLDPVSIFVAVLAGAAIAGVYGMLLSIPVAACLKIYLREVVMPHLRDWSSGRADDPLPLRPGEKRATDREVSAFRRIDVKRGGVDGDAQRRRQAADARLRAG